MKARTVTVPVVTTDRLLVPSHVPTGPALLALRLAEEARGIRGLDVLHRSVDRAPPVSP